MRSTGLALPARFPDRRSNVPLPPSSSDGQARSPVASGDRADFPWPARLSSSWRGRWARNILPGCKPPFSKTCSRVFRVDARLKHSSTLTYTELLLLILVKTVGTNFRIPVRFSWPADCPLSPPPPPIRPNTIAHSMRAADRRSTDEPEGRISTAHLPILTALHHSSVPLSAFQHFSVSASSPYCGLPRARPGEESAQRP